MTELKPSMILRYFTNDLGKHYTAVVLKNKTILSVKKAGKKDKTVYESVDHWLATLPGSVIPGSVIPGSVIPESAIPRSVTISDIDIKEREISIKSKPPITLKTIAPNYDLFRFLLTYEAYGLKDSLASTNTSRHFATHTYVKDAEGNIHPVNYNRRYQLLHSEYHNVSGSTLEEIGFPPDADIYVRIPTAYYGANSYHKWSMDKAKFPFTYQNYESFYDAKIAFVPSRHQKYIWNSQNHYDLLTNYLKEKGYYIYSQYFTNLVPSSIFHPKKANETLEANIIVVQPCYKSTVILNTYKPVSHTVIKFKDSDESIPEEIKTILE